MFAKNFSSHDCTALSVSWHEMQYLDKQRSIRDLNAWGRTIVGSPDTVKLISEFLLLLLGLDECYDLIISLRLTSFESARIMNNNPFIGWVRYWSLDIVLSSTVMTPAY